MPFIAFDTFLTVLQEFGLTLKEATTYFVLLTLGEAGGSPVSLVAKKASVNRSHCYQLLSSLTRKGFVHEVFKDGTIYYAAVPFQAILSHLRHKNTELLGKIEMLDQSLIEFKALTSSDYVKPKVLLCEGLPAIRNMMEDSLNSRGIIRSYSSLHEFFDLMPEYFKDYYDRMVRKKIYLKAIHPVHRESYFHKLKDVHMFRQSRLIPREFDFHFYIGLYDNKMVIISLYEKLGILIESKELVASKKKLFDFLWVSIKHYDELMVDMMVREIERES